MTNTRCRLGTVFYPNGGHIVARNMQRKAINILRKFVLRFRSVYKGLYKEARSTKHKIYSVIRKAKIHAFTEVTPHNLAQLIHFVGTCCVLRHCGGSRNTGVTAYKTAEPQTQGDYILYRVIHKSLRHIRTRLRNNQDRHGRKEHINR